jgi:uracil-DNA glycosylase
MATLNIPPVRELAQKLYERLGPGWSDILKDFVCSSQFEDILTSLQKEVREGRRFTPPLKQVFRPFELCPYQNLHTIFIGTEPYFTEGVADGLLFSTPNGARKPAALRRLHEAINETIHTEGQENQNDLEYVAKQGVLLLNATLTTQMGQPVGHYNIWDPFMHFLIKKICAEKKDLLFVFLGKGGQPLGDLIGDEHCQFYLDHPANALKNEWECADIFNRLNRMLLEQGNIIVW